MVIDAALVKEQGVSFTVVCVRSGATKNSVEAGKTQAAFSPHFDGVPVVLMKQDSRRRPTYFGRPDIVNFLTRISVDRLPWREWHVN